MRWRNYDYSEGELNPTPEQLKELLVTGRIAGYESTLLPATRWSRADVYARLIAERDRLWARYRHMMSGR